MDLFEEHIDGNKRVLWDCRKHKEVAVIYSSGDVSIPEPVWKRANAQVLIGFLAKGPMKPRYRITQTFNSRPTSVRCDSGNDLWRLEDEDIEEVWE